jgi:hypothetical protein
LLPLWWWWCRLSPGNREMIIFKVMGVCVCGGSMVAVSVVCGPASLLS